MDTRQDLDNKLNTKLVLDPRIDLETPDVYWIQKGGEYVRVHREVADSNTNTNSIHFSVVPPSKSIVVDKKVYIKYYLQVRLQSNVGDQAFVDIAGGTGANARILGNRAYVSSPNFGLRWMALQNCTESLTTTFNSTTVSQNLSDYIEFLGRIGHNNEYEEYDLSIAPSMHDQYQDFIDWNYFGSGRNPLDDYGTNDANQTRGAIRWYVVDGAGNPTIPANNAALAGDLYLRCEVMEPILMSPFNMSKVNGKGFIGLTNLDFTFNLSNLGRMICYYDRAPTVGNGAALDTLTVSFFQTPELHLTFLTPPSLFPIPRDNLYPYYEVNRYPLVETGAVEGDTELQLNSNNIQLSSVPKRLIICVRESTSRRTFATPDSYARIEGIEIQFNNKNALLGSADSKMLYNISVKNGLKMSYTQWQFFTGSVCVIDFGQDISLDPAMSVGQRGQFNLQVNVRARSLLIDQNGQPRKTRRYQLYMVVVNEGVFQVYDTDTRLYVGDVQPYNLLASERWREIERIPYHEAYDYVGGSFWDTLKRWGKKAWNVGKKIVSSPVTREIAKKVIPLLMGAGYSESEAMKMVQGSGLTARGLTGGKIAPKSRLRKRM